MRKKYIILSVLLCMAAVGIGVAVGVGAAKGSRGEEEQEPVQEEEMTQMSYGIDAALSAYDQNVGDALTDTEDTVSRQQDDSADPEQDDSMSQGDDDKNMYEEQQEISEEETKMTQMSVSIMGDSISTFRGYIPDGYNVFFPDSGAVTDVNDTWWKQVADDLGLTLCANASSSASTCAGDSTSQTDPQVGCDDMRVSDLAGAGGESPDIIIVYMGTNDFIECIPLGTNDGTAQVPEGNIQNFSDAYTLMLDKLQAKYPEAAIYCCTITAIGTWGTDTPFVEFVNGVGDGLKVPDYNAVIRQVAANKGATVIDLYNCGITVDNLQETTADGVHPTPLGMGYIADKVKESLAAARD
jgi:lysophospholipase L1-like esterase